MKHRFEKDERKIQSKCSIIIILAFIRKIKRAKKPTEFLVNSSKSNDVISRYESSIKISSWKNIFPGALSSGNLPDPIRFENLHHSGATVSKTDNPLPVEYATRWKFPSRERKIEGKVEKDDFYSRRLPKNTDDGIVSHARELASPSKESPTTKQGCIFPRGLTWHEPDFRSLAPLLNGFHPRRLFRDTHRCCASN